MPTGSIRVVLLDVNETLTDLRPLDAGFAEVGLEGLRPLWFAQVLRDGFAAAARGGNPDFATVGADVLRTMAAGEHAIDRVLSAFSSLPVHADVAPGIAALRERGLVVAAFTNGSAAVTRSVFDRADVLRSFDHVLSVEDAPAWKPAAAAYRWAVGEIGVASSEALLVAVHPWDVAGAAGAGLRSAWIDRESMPYPTHLDAPQITAPSLIELAERLA